MNTGIATHFIKKENLQKAKEAIEALCKNKENVSVEDIKEELKKHGEEYQREKFKFKNEDLINAASDLGANKYYIFKKITFPLSLPGVLSGITMVFMPAVSTFVISNLLGGGQYMLIGNLIETQFTTMSNWNFGSAISIIMMIIILLSMLIMNRFSDNDEKEEVSVHGK